jgi:hypothetical protein
LFIEPRLRLGFRDDREDLDVRFCNVMKDPDVSNAKAVLRLAEAAKPFDATLPHLRWLVPQMPLDRLLHPCADRRWQVLQRAGRVRGHDDLVRHCG